MPPPMNPTVLGSSTGVGGGTFFDDMVANVKEKALFSMRDHFIAKKMAKMESRVMP